MDKIIFFAPDILQACKLPVEEALHCVKVLRHKAGDEILITDGEGHFFEAVLNNPDPKNCTVNIIKQVNASKPWNFTLQLAFAPTKNIDRVEWLAEKVTEIGVDRISPLLCRYSERKEIKPARIQKIMVSAMKQSRKAILPQLDGIQPFKSFIKQPFNGSKFIAHCEPGDKPLLKEIYNKAENTLILIGPEGDFSTDEIREAVNNGFRPVSLGESRLRTETAALVACHTIHVLNQ